MLTRIIPASWRILFIVLAMAAAAALGWQEGAMHAGREAMRRDIATAAATADRIQQLNAQARATERRHAQAMADISATHQRSLTDAQNQLKADRAALRAGTLRLRDPAHPADCRSASPQAGPTAARRDDASPGELSGEAAEFLLDLATDADIVAHQLEACQRVIKSDRE